MLHCHSYRARLLDEVDGLNNGNDNSSNEDNENDHDYDEYVTDDNEVRDIPLAVLAERGDLYVVTQRLENGADPNESDSSGETALHTAVGISHMPLVRVLLLHNAALDPPLSLCGWTPLHKAAARGNADILRLLLEFGADLRLKKTDGDLAIDLARRNNRETCVKLLEWAVEMGAPDCDVLRPRVVTSLQQLCAVAVRKHYLQKNNIALDGRVWERTSVYSADVFNSFHL